MRAFTDTDRDPSLRSATVLEVNAVIWVPGGAVAKDGIEGDEQFAHAGDEREFARVAAFEQCAVMRGADRY